MPDYPYVEIPGEQYGLPKYLLGPTGNVFLHPGGVSTHLNMITGDVPGLEGKQALIPLLVPGQQDIGALLSNPQGATKEQRQIAIRHAGGRVKGGEMLPAFDTVEETEAYEQQWHEATARLGHAHIQQGMMQQFRRRAAANDE
jgi:hypothetical protein